MRAPPSSTPPHSHQQLLPALLSADERTTLPSTLHAPGPAPSASAPSTSAASVSAGAAATGTAEPAAATAAARATGGGAPVAWTLPPAQSCDLLLDLELPEIAISEAEVASRGGAAHALIEYMPCMAKCSAWSDAAQGLSPLKRRGAASNAHRPQPSEAAGCSPYATPEAVPCACRRQPGL